MILLALLYLCFFSGSWNTFALPTDSRWPEILPKNHLHSIFIRDEDRFDSRSIYGILWSCLATIFACTWITVHPNIPAPGDSQWAVLRRRLAIMGYFLLAPEFVIMWAARQHFDVRYLTTKYETKHPGWTRAHSFFLIMGGFTLHEGGNPVRVLEAKDLEELSVEPRKIEWPTITKEEIADRSKGDYLSKTIVLFQMIWFVGQCIARWTYGLTVTELEVVTVAFASLTGVIYYLWWDKPLDVRCSIPVHLLRVCLEDIRKEETGPQMIPSPEICAEEIPEPDEDVVANHNPLPATSIQVDTTTLDPAPTRMQRFQAFRRGACKEYGTLFGLGYVFIGFPLKQFIYSFGDMWDCTTLGDKRLWVPTFYSSDDHDDDNRGIPFRLAVWVATGFGTIHGIAWYLQFATWQERWAWRISAILVSGLPIAWILVMWLFTIFSRRNNTPTWMMLHQGFITLILIAFACLYIIARIVLLVLPFVALRALPPGAYVQLNWVSFLPHIWTPSHRFKYNFQRQTPSLVNEFCIFKGGERLGFRKRDGWDYILLFPCENPDGNDVLITPIYSTKLM